MTVYRAGSYVSQNKSQEREEGSFNTRVTVTEGTTPQSRSRLVQSPSVGNVHRSSVDEYKAHDTNHEPYSSVHRPAASPQTSLPSDEGSLDLGLVTQKQHKQLSDRSRKGKRKVD